MKITPLGWIAAAAGAYALFAFTKIRRISTLTFFPGTIHSFSFAGSIPVLEFNISIQNTSSLPVTVKSLAGNIFSSGYLVGNVTSTSIIDIPSNSNIQTRVKAQLSLLGIVNNLIAAFQNRDSSKEISFEGFANVDNLQIPLNLKFNLGL